MANTVSQLMSDLLATPTVMASVGEDHGRKRAKIARYSSVVGDAANHQYRLCKLKAHDRITSLRVWCSADAGMTVCDVGIFVPQIGKVGTETLVAVDQDGLADGVALQGALIGIEQYGVGTNAVNELLYGKQLWEACATGPATSPEIGTEYEIVVVVAGNPGGGGNYSWLIEYLAGD